MNPGLASFLGRLHIQGGWDLKLRAEWAVWAAMARAGELGTGIPHWLVLIRALCMPLFFYLGSPAPLPWPFAPSPLPLDGPNDLAQVASYMEKPLQGNKSPCYQPGPQVCAWRPSQGWLVSWAFPPPQLLDRDGGAVCHVCMLTVCVSVQAELCMHPGVHITVCASACVLHVCLCAGDRDQHGA